MHWLHLTECLLYRNVSLLNNKRTYLLSIFLRRRKGSIQINFIKLLCSLSLQNLSTQHAGYTELLSTVGLYKALLNVFIRPNGYRRLSVNRNLSADCQSADCQWAEYLSAEYLSADWQSTEYQSAECYRGNIIRPNVNRWNVYAPLYLRLCTFC